MAKVTFDGGLKRINVDGSTVSLNVEQDLYSEWKIWSRSDENLAYLAAFRTFGGDTTIPGQTAPKYFFLTNGWRVYVDGVSIIVATNLYTDEAEFPFILSNGAAVSLTNSDVAISDQEAIQYGSFDGGVTIDTIKGGAGIAYPKGNTQFPSNNIPDVNIIADSRGFHRVFVKGDLSIGATDTVEGFTIIGENAARTSIDIHNDSNTNMCEIQESYVTGSLDNNIILRNCMVQDINYFNGVLYNSLLQPGTIHLGNNAVGYFLDCKSGVPGQSTPIIDMGGTGQSLAIRGYDGGVKIINKSGPESCSIDLTSGQVIIDLPTVTNGNIVVRGDGKVIDQLGNNMLTGTYGTLDFYNETTPSPTEISDAIWQASTRTLTAAGTSSLTTEEHDALINGEVWSRKAGTQRLV